MWSCIYPCYILIIDLYIYIYIESVYTKSYYNNSQSLNFEGSKPQTLISGSQSSLSSPGFTGYSVLYCHCPPQQKETYWIDGRKRLRQKRIWQSKLLNFNLKVIHIIFIIFNQLGPVTDPSTQPQGTNALLNVRKVQTWKYLLFSINNYHLDQQRS